MAAVSGSNNAPLVVLLGELRGSLSISKTGFQDHKHDCLSVYGGCTLTLHVMGRVVERYHLVT